MGAPQGHRAGRHGGLYPSRLAGGASGNAGACRRRRICTAEGVRPAVRRGRRGRPRPLCGIRGDQHHLQEGWQDPEGASRHPAARAGRGGGAGPSAGSRGQPAQRRTAHSGHGQPGSSADDHGRLSGRDLYSGPYLDAPFFCVRGIFPIFHAGGMLRRHDRLHPRAGNRAFFRSAHEPAGVSAGFLPAGVQFRRPFAPEAGPGGQSAFLRRNLWRAETRAGDRRGL